MKLLYFYCNVKAQQHLLYIFITSYETIQVTHTPDVEQVTC